MDKDVNRSNSIKNGINKFLVSIMLGIITVYRKFISPALPPSCRFIPTCSEYGLEAFKKFGFIKGFVLTTKRICKCRPGGPYGYDPVPEEYPNKNNK